MRFGNGWATRIQHDRGGLSLRVTTPEEAGTDPSVVGLDPAKPPIPDAPVVLTLRLDALEFARYEALLEALRKQEHREKKELLMLAGLEALVLSGKPARSSTVTAGSRPATPEATETIGADTPRESREDSGQPAEDRESDRPEAEPHFPRGKNIPRSPYQVSVLLCPQCGTGEVPSRRGPLKLSPATLKAILCDAHVHGHGRANRASIPPSTRLAVLVRDRYACRVQGCRNTRFLAVHHLNPRAAGGGNDPSNLITLCSECHRWAHDNSP